MFKIIFSLFIKTVIKSVTSLIGGLATLKDNVEEKGVLFTLSRKLLDACKTVGSAFAKGHVYLGGIFFIGNLLNKIAGISKGRSLVSLLALVAPAMDAYDRLKKYIADRKSEAMLNAAIKNDSGSLVRCKRDYKAVKDLATCRLIADKMYLDFSVKSMIVTVRRKIAKMIGGIINRLSNIKVKNSKGKAAIKKIINGLKAIQKKIDVPEKKPSKFLKILAGTSAALGGLVFVAKHAAPFLPPPAGAITSMIGNVASYAKSGVDTVQEGVDTAKEIKEKIVDA